ncbi:hypothetical protein HJFPF1_12628 [Paramyrothecium foliicola]|nr:hypothetical protein HJFPF1_12628 [Paramyrothecium foliicola]
MAEALAGLSIAANVAQFVTLGLKGAAFIREVYASSDGVIAEQQELQAISEGVHSSCERLRKDASIVSDSSLETLLQKATSLSRDLKHELTKLQRLAADQSYLGKIKLLVRATRKKGTIELLQRRLAKVRDQATFHLVSLS